MAISTIPLASASSMSEGTKYSVDAAIANNPYRVTFPFTSGTYSIECAASTVASITFWNDGDPIGTAVTSSGAVAFNLGEDATDITYWVSTGTNETITIAKTAVPLAAGISGTLDTITTSGTYNETGFAYIFAVGGGYSGSQGTANSGGSGGASGTLATATEIINLEDYVPVTVTVGGVGGGNSSFGNLVNTANGNASVGVSQSTVSGAGLPILPGSTGGGGNGVGLSGCAGVGGGDGGIGRGGDGGGGCAPGVGGGGSGTGWGAGGGGGSRSGSNNFRYQGGSGSPGAVFVLRF